MSWAPILAGAMSVPGTAMAETPRLSVDPAAIRLSSSAACRGGRSHPRSRARRSRCRAACHVGQPARPDRRRGRRCQREGDPPAVGLRRLQRTPGSARPAGQRLVEVDDHAAPRAVARVQFGERAVVHDPAVVDDHEPPAQPLDVGQVVRGEHERRCRRVAPSSARKPRTACLLTTSSPIVGSSRNSTSGPCSRAAVSSPRIRWPSESCRTGVSRTASRSSSSPAAAAAGPRGRRPAPGRRGAAARRSRAAAGPTRAGERWPKTTPIRRASRRRCGTGVEPADPQVPGGRREDAGQHLQRRRLAGAVRADVAEQSRRARRSGRCRPRRPTAARAPAQPARPCTRDRELLAQPAASMTVTTRYSGSAGRPPATSRRRRHGGDRRRPAARPSRARPAARAGRAGRAATSAG